MTRYTSPPRHAVPPLRDIIYQRGESLLSVSSSCAVPYAVLVEVAEGRRLPSEDVATAVAAHFDLEAVDLFGEAAMCYPEPSKDKPAPEPREHFLTPVEDMPRRNRPSTGARRSKGSIVHIDAGRQPASDVIKAFGVSRREFCETYQLTYGELVESLRGNRVPHRETVAILVAATQLPIEKLFTEDVLARM